MKKYLIGCYAAASVISMASCQEDVKSEAPAAIIVTSPQKGEKVWLNTLLKAETATEQADGKVMFYLNDELVGEDGEAPYEVMLNTRQYEDGAYTLRTVIQNGSGEPTEAVQTINIFNKLFSLKVDDNYLEGQTYAPKEAWLIVCDTEGNIIRTEELQNGETINIDREDRTDEKLIITLVHIFASMGDHKEVWIESYQDIAPNAWCYRGFTSNNQPTIGTAQVDYTIPSGMQTTISASNAYAWLSEVNEGYQASLTISEEPAELFIANNDQDIGEASYAWLKDIRVDEQYNLEAKDFLPMKLMKQVSFSPSEEVYFNVRGYNKQAKVSHRLLDYRNRDGAPEQLSIYHPEGLFDSYYHYVSMKQGQVTYYHAGNDVLKGAYEVPEVYADVTEEGREYRIQIQGNYEADFAVGHWGYYTLDNGITEAVNWYVNSSVSEGEYRPQLLQLPAEIINRHPLVGDAQQNMRYRSTTLYNYDSIASLSDFLKNRYQADIEPTFGAREEISIRATDSQGGRTMGSVPKSFAEKIEALRQRR